jgi:hypothetical protein
MKLIDILNKIANGELKEGTKVIIDELEYIYREGLEDTNILFKNGWEIGNYDIFQMINAEVELIEPDDFADVGKMAEPTECEHEWSKYSIGRFGRTENYRRCKKCGMHEEDIEPTDNTKIEELDAYELDLLKIFYKLNEIIRYINK